MAGPGEGFGMGPRAQKRQKNMKNCVLAPLGLVTLHVVKSCDVYQGRDYRWKIDK